MLPLNRVTTWLKWVEGSPLFWVLLSLNVLATIAVTVASIHIIRPDQAAYLGYATGLQHGIYTYWYFLPDYLPDTFRNPGYPLFLYLLRQIGLSDAGIRIVQLGLYVSTVGLTLRIAQRCERQPGSRLVRNLFLLLLLPNVQLAYFAAVIYPEIVVAFLVCLYGYVAVAMPPGQWKRTILLAVLAGLIFQTRPIFVFFPLIQLGLDFWQHRSKAAMQLAHAGVLLGLFGATMVPYALWNYRHHEVFKPTSLEGGAGVMQVGFWASKMPGYQEKHYWGNYMGNEMVSFTDSAAIPGNIAAFNQEWAVIEAQCRPLLTARDLRYLPLMRRYADSLCLFPTYNSAYTLRREKLLMAANLADIRREPGYYLKTRLYTLVRLWITGIQTDEWHKASSLVAKLKILYPFAVGVFTFVLALLSIGWVLAHRRLLQCPPAWRLALALVVYFGLIHLPFAIQARYTVPVRLWLLLATAIALATLLVRPTQAVMLAEPDKTAG